ncbi:uncharacterized protein I303_101380 [Kwoniella dejecticola CBS 10117]|uniref:Uncharacterized protein n=1 Tax=Kwoniella dejecticola CBS 10117 TaxID=1296121 RepID=A0AAJ8ME07_9TREE
MTSAPSFSSFPDFSQENEAGPSRNKAIASVPSFGSFPDLEQPKRSKRRSRSPSASHDERQSKRKDGEEPKHRSHKRENDDEYRDRRRTDHERRERIGEDGGPAKAKEKEKNRRHNRSRSKERHEGRDREKDRHRREHRERDRDRDRDRDRNRHRERERDRSADRKYKEERRRKEREKALSLIRGDTAQDIDLGKGKKKEEKWEKKYDGLAWYESVGNGKPKQAMEEGDSTPSASFFPDTVGDRDAVRYGSTSSNSVPRYHREGKNRILGLNDGLRIVYSRDRTEKGVEIAPLGRPYVPRYNSRQTRAAASQHLRSILLQPSDEQGSFNPFSEYIDFGIKRSQHNEKDLPSYRDIHQPQDDDSEGLESIEAAIGSYSTLEAEVRQETSALEGYLRENSGDVERWIDYSQLHLRLSPDLSHQSDKDRTSKTRAEAEVALSVLSRALDASTDNFSSTRLHLAYLRVAEEFWPTEKVTNRWKNVLRELGERGNNDVEMMDLWLGYISWREGHGFAGQGGGVDEVVEVYEECIGKLKANTSGDAVAREENLLYLFLRSALFLRQAGYTERAIAAFQALIEITFFKPDQWRSSRTSTSSHDHFDKTLDGFELFWDSEAPRVGEPGARGWRNAISTSEPKPPKSSSLKHISDDPFERWLEAELRAENTYAMPGRATVLDNEVEDDPYHTILFSDIRPFVFDVTSPEVRLQLIYAFLSFLGLPFTPPDMPSSSPATNDPYLQWTLAQNPQKRNAFWPPRQSQRKLPWQTVGGEPMDPERSRGLDHPFESPVKNWLQDRSSLLGRKGSWFTDLEAVDIVGLDVDLIRNVFYLLRPLVPDPAFTLANFAFESAVSPKGAVKFAKSILATDRDNLLLWDGYARLERQRGNYGVARTVYITALQAAISHKTHEVMSEDELDLWAGWAEMESELGEEDRTLEVVILASGTGQDRLSDHMNTGRVPASPAPMALLKSRQHYSNILSPSPSQLFLKSLFLYLTDGVEPAQSFLLNHLASLPPSSGEAEQTLQLLTKILYLHSSRHSTPASLARSTLETALASFPNNTAFLSLYLYGELGGRVYGRVQRLVADLTSSVRKDQDHSGGLMVHLWAIWAEGVSAHRTFWDKGGTGAERVRLALDKGINSPSGKPCAGLWMLYIEFEVLMGRYNSAKQLCYRAVASLGGCKALYLLPFSPSLRPHYTPRELQEWSELILERGVRIRVAFERYFDTPPDEGMLEDLPQDEELQEDELGFLTQRETAKPY